MLTTIRKNEYIYELTYRPQADCLLYEGRGIVFFVFKKKQKWTQKSLTNYYILDSAKASSTKLQPPKN